MHDQTCELNKKGINAVFLESAQMDPNVSTQAFDRTSFKLNVWSHLLLYHLAFMHGCTIINNANISMPTQVQNTHTQKTKQKKKKQVLQY